MKANTKYIFPLILFFINSGITLAQTKYAYDQNSKSIYYESIIPFVDKNKLELMNKVEKYLLINNLSIKYKDENEIIAVGSFETIYRSYLLGMFYVTKPYKMIYDVKFSFKDGKFKYYANNFNLLPKSINLKTTGWFSNNYGSPSNTLGSMWSNTKVPTEIPRKPIEAHYNAGKTKRKYKVFQSMDANMAEFEGKLKKVIVGDNNDW